MASHFFQTLAWSALLLLCIGFCEKVALASAMTRMFPEGRRSWHFLIEISAFLITALVALTCPLIKVTLA